MSFPDAMLTCTDTVPSLSVDEGDNLSCSNVAAARNGGGGGDGGGGRAKTSANCPATRSHASSQVSIPGLDWDEQVKALKDIYIYFGDKLMSRQNTIHMVTPILP